MLSSEPLLRRRHSLSHYLHAGLVKYLHKASSFQNGCQGHLQVVQEGKESAPASTRVCLEKEKEVKPEWRPAQRLDDGDPGLVYLQKAFSEGKESEVSTRVCLEQEKEVKLEGRPAQRLDDGDPGLVYLQKASSLQTGCQGHPPVAQEGKESAAASTSMCLEQEKEVELGGRPAERLDDGDPGLVYRDDDRLWTVVSSVVKIVTCFSAMLLTTIFWTIIMLLLLPFPYVRIKQGNVYGHVTGRILMWILGNPIKIYGTEYANLKAIYVCNHASPLDIFLVMWLTPTGTVGIAKKEIIWYPLFGQLYVLANHLRIDRSNSVSSIQSMRKIARTVVDRNLSLIVFPEGTRSASGRLLPFKKGFVHLAIQTKLPIVPMVLTGTHLGWQKNSLRVRPAPLTVTYLPPIKTDDWTTDNVETYVDMLHALYAKHLPPSQKPLEMVADNSH